MSSVPNIVITEPSPSIASFSIARDADNIATPVSNPESVTAFPTSDDETQSTMVSYTDTPSSEKTKIRNDQMTREVIQPVEQDGNSDVRKEKPREISNVDGRTAEVAPRNDVPAENDLRSRQLYYGAIGYFRSSVDSFVNSKYMLPIQVLFLAVPISAGCMGAIYMDKCPVNNVIPMFVFMMGVAGCMVILCRMTLVLQSIFSSIEREESVLSTIAVCGNLAIILFLCTEMVAFMRMDPSFQLGTENYCHETFYTYTYWMNWASLFFVILVGLFQVPKCRLRGLRIAREP